ncbi:MAG: hypothetical protein DRI95_12565 [Bacteroidetes bacterium]|nr:MAG: hypothetical protein DRI95_12565 [Bacteroidota bacterium]RLD73960.1 MAG: hypothetical protein DRJ07_20150 [Bacteroidota bacterium]
MKNKGAIIMLAWPDTPAIQVGSWYEPLMKWFGFNKNGYYKAGHSAIVLVKPETGRLQYFDFGRYHTPIKHGRVRDNFTDPDLTIMEVAEFNSKSEIINIDKLLLALSKYESFHGKGNMHASINYNINFDKAFRFAKKQQKKDAIPYGPFAYRGTNCSRFTSRVLRAGSREFYRKIQTILSLSLTQTPLGNVLISAKENIFYKVENSFVHKYRANIFTFLTHWTLPPVKAVPIIFSKKLGLLKQGKLLVRN